MLIALEQRLVDAAADIVSRLPDDGTYLNTVGSAVMDIHGDIFTGATSVPARELLPHPYQHPDANPPRLLRFSPQHWSSVIDGVKTATTRFGDPTEPGETTLLFEFDDRFRSLPGAVDSVEHVRFADITDAQAALEDCTADELRTALRTYYYPDVADDDVVDFVRFRTVEES